jgi:hypothetical protein
MLRVFRETTIWPDATPNHTYILSTNKEFAHGYVKSGQQAGSVIMFKKPMRFDIRRRTFVEIK